jgi:uncharacterized protein YdeI (YjbR/CyaY-like superfamily)
MPSGLSRAPTDRSGDAPRPTSSASEVPAYIRATIRKHAAAWKFFEGLAPSHRAKYIAWIDSAKKEETKLKRLQEAIQKLAAGHKPTLK